MREWLIEFNFYDKIIAKGLPASAHVKSVTQTKGPAMDRKQGRYIRVVQLEDQQSQQGISK